jgi:ABC-type antimicrobial peptide transport system permease subunit
VRLTVAGLGLGLVVALGLGTAMQSLLFEIDGRDPVVYAAVAALLGLAAVAACWIPAARASSIDPVRALMSE